jgi:predicted O-linked N-acetylglucosamine transferase (SPINDLY family)
MLRKLYDRLFGSVHSAPPKDGAAALTREADGRAGEGRLHDALARYRAALAADPAALDAQLGMANVMVDLWMLDDAVTAYERALALAPQSAAIRSALLFHRHYAATIDAQALFDAHRQAGAQMMTKGRAVVVPQRRAHAGRRLRIGYVSPNFSRHSVGYFIEPVMRHHDRAQFEIFCYYSHPKADDTTARLRAMADGWRDIAEIDGAALDAMVRADGIDVLVDLAGHSKANRLAAFALGPAPVQITWLGYPDTSGLPAMDVRITDAIADPAPQADAFNSERLVRIDGGMLCYQPPADAPPVATRVNAASGVVFCSFNNIAKLNAGMIHLWCAILEAVPGSRLVLKSASLNFAETADRVLESFEEFGVAAGRVEVRGWVAQREQHLRMYEGIDIALDTYPYNGTTTTCEALWMGVPVVTRAGGVHMSRVGASLLHAAGLDDLVTHDAQEYVDAAVALAGDELKRRELRASLRPRLEASPLLDHAGFTRKLEQVYRDSFAAA